MKKILLFLFFPILSFSQSIDHLFFEKGEINFSFQYKNKLQLNMISNIVSIDHKTNADLAYAYANQKQFLAFIKLGIDYEIIEKKIIQFENGSANNWSYYPTYEEYVDMMTSFEDSFPNICKLHHLGTLNSGREILIVQISNNVGVKENKPSFLYTSSMHGDELAGYILSLRLIDHILNGYGNTLKLTQLVDNIDIWINPLANPDGAYAGGNQDVWSATRFNADTIDLNRNYPDPQDGPHPDGNLYQNETNIFMGLADTVSFTISANMHSGAEVCNYPWDTWSNLTADDSWWQYVSREYVDSCQANSGNGYFEWSNGLNPFANGVVNGYDWYEVIGGRQDYMNYFKYCREFTLELSDDKTPDPNDLPELWDANYPSLLNYIEQSLFGLRGIVTDSITGLPLKAKVEILNHDIDSSHVYSNLPIGNYHRHLYQGNYDVNFSKSGYYPKTINTTILNNTAVIQDVQLVPFNTTQVEEINPSKNTNTTFDLLGRTSNKKSKIQLFKTKKGAITKQIKIQ